VAAAYWPHVYTLDHVLMMLGMLMFSGLAFFVLLPLMKRTPSLTLDIDWIWRRGIPRFWKEVVMPLLMSLNKAQQAVLENLPGRGIATNGLPAPISRRIGSAWAVSVPVFTIMLMLLAYLVIYFVLPGL
jgi:multicomponent Na+:H+ antiporter subunit D